MKFASFKINGATSWGLIDGNDVADLGAVLRDKFPDLKSAIAAGALAEAAKAAGKATRHPLTAITWLPGQMSTMHGHHVWCVYGIAEGWLAVPGSHQWWPLRPPERP